MIVNCLRGAAKGKAALPDQRISGLAKKRERLSNNTDLLIRTV
jgi:hypothetical protein